MTLEYPKELELPPNYHRWTTSRQRRWMNANAVIVPKDYQPKVKPKKDWKTEVEMMRYLFGRRLKYATVDSKK